jgi:hypothetical protein
MEGNGVWLVLFGEGGGEVQADDAHEDGGDIAAVWDCILLERGDGWQCFLIDGNVPVPIVQAGSKSIVYVCGSRCWTVVDFVKDAMVNLCRCLWYVENLLLCDRRLGKVVPLCHCCLPGHQCHDHLSSLSSRGSVSA